MKTTDVPTGLDALPIIGATLLEIADRVWLPALVLCVLVGLGVMALVRGGAR